MRIEIDGKKLALFVLGAAFGAILAAVIGYYGFVLPQRARYDAAIRNAIVEDFVRVAPADTAEVKAEFSQKGVWDLLAEVGSAYKQTEDRASQQWLNFSTCSAQLASYQQQNAAARPSATGYDLLNAWKPGLGTVVQRLQQQQH